MFKLYKYQEEAVTNAVSNLFERNNSLIVAGTGAGKTIMLSETIRQFTIGFKSKYGTFPHTLVLVHRTEIHNQNLNKFSKVAPSIPTSEITADRKSVHGLVHFGMVQTVINVLNDLPQFDLIVIDEAHHSMAETYKKIIDANKNKQLKDIYLLGVSATPNRGDKLPLIELFDNFYQITTKFLIDSHYLVRPKFIDLSPRFGKEIGFINKNINWDNEEAKKIINKLVNDYLSNKEPGKTIIFAPNHKICNLINESLKDKGKMPAYLTNNIPDDLRASEIGRFEKGDADELINVDIATEGYDYPELRNVVDFDTNGNETQWIQKVGRGLRTAPCKNGCTVIDFGGNIQLYPNVEVDVNLEGGFKTEKGTRLTENDFFKTGHIETQKPKQNASFSDKEEITPYNPPIGWETLNDSELGIVFIKCNNKKDGIIIKQNDKFKLFSTDKQKLKFECEDEFKNCIIAGNEIIGDVIIENRLITNMQIKKLSPKYPTMTLNFYGANCILCWEAWHKVVKNEIQSK